MPDSTHLYPDHPHPTTAPAAGPEAPPTLVLTFTEGISLATWRDTGMLAREWALYRELLPYYSRIVLITYGHDAEAELLRPFVLDRDAAKVAVIANENRLPVREYVATLPRRVELAIHPGTPAIVKTNQMQGGEAALAVASHLRDSGHTTALVARGGYPWSLFVENDKGPDSREATEVRAREGALVHAADVIVGTTREMLDHLAARHAIDPRTTRLIPNYVDLTRDPTPVQQRAPATLLYAGQLVARKRVDLLIDALALLPDGLPLAHLDVLGDGPELPRLKRLAEALRVPVRFEPRVPHHDLLARMHSCTLYVQASGLEGHPKTVIEAMTTGAPVIVADAPGLEVVTHAVDGLKVAGGARALAAAIADLLRQPRLRSRLGTTAAHTARRLYGLPTVLQLELRAHADALHSSPQPASFIAR